MPCLLNGIEAGAIGGWAILALLISGSLWRAIRMLSNLPGWTLCGARALAAPAKPETLAAYLLFGACVGFMASLGEPLGASPEARPERDGVK
ncbi:MAG TPA: hypothetical protein VGJ09_07535 [Bryobacteraceae bacterium]